MSLQVMPGELWAQGYNYCFSHPLFCFLFFPHMFNFLVVLLFFLFAPSTLSDSAGVKSETGQVSLNACLSPHWSSSSVIFMNDV